MIIITFHSRKVGLQTQSRPPKLTSWQTFGLRDNFQSILLS